MSVEFTQKWVEQAVQKLFNKNDITADDMKKIKYLLIGESFENDFYIQMSLEKPPKPFADYEGGDEWTFCLRGDDISKLVEKFKDTKDDYLSMYGLDSEDEEWEETIYSEKAEKRWEDFSGTVAEERYYERCDNDDAFDEWYENVRENTWNDINLFTGVEVLRVHGLTIPDLLFLKNFPELRVVELVETVFHTTEGIELLLKLEQLSCWGD